MINVQFIHDKSQTDNYRYSILGEGVRVARGGGVNEMSVRLKNKNKNKNNKNW